MKNFNNYFNDINIAYDIEIIPFKNKMNERYLKQCLYNLQEKYDCDLITDKEWKLIGFEN